MKRAFILVMILTASSCVFAQESGNTVFFQTAGPTTSVAIGGAMIGKAPTARSQGAPYSATIKNENIQTLGDGNWIIQTSTRNTARDSARRRRHEQPLP